MKPSPAGCGCEGCVTSIDSVIKDIDSALKMRHRV